jgi:hypothetical protein
LSGLLGVTSVAVLLLGVFPFQAGSQEPPPPPERVSITVLQVVKGGFQKDVDLNPPGSSPGDYGVIRGRIVDPDSCRMLGTMTGRYNIVKRAGEDDSYVLTDIVADTSVGNLVAMMSGKLSDLGRGDGLLGAVTGGTGDYSDVRGEVLARSGKRACGSAGTKYHFDLLIT